MMITDPAAQQKAVTTSRISLSGVHKRFGDLAVLKGVDIGVEPGEVVVFDVNHRPALWRHRPAQAAPVLLELARGADLVFVGRDEAETLWGTHTAQEVRDLLGPGPVLVVKDAGHGATAYGTDGEETFVPTPATRVVEPVGAGDAFAAGYLAALLEGRTPANGLRLGHLVAAATLSTREDVPPVLNRDALDRRLALDNAAWSTLRLT